MGAKEDRDPGGKLPGEGRRLTMAECYYMCLMDYNGTWAAGPGPSRFLQGLFKTTFAVS